MIKFTARIRNEGDEPLGLQVEPWGEYYRIEPRAHVDILVQGREAGLFEIEHRRDQVTVYAWSGAEFKIVGAEMEPWPNAGRKKPT